MKASIYSEGNRSAGNSIIFEVDESNYNQEKIRKITKKNSLNGTVLTTNWGAPEGDRVIQLNNIELSQSDYDILIGMLEDDDYNFLYSYLNSTWKITINFVRGIWNGKKRLTSINLGVVSKYSDGEA